MGRVKLRTIIDFRNGDKQAFEEIFYAFKDILYYFSYLYVHNYDDANDCVQEIFIKIINTIDKFKDSLSQFDTWVYSTARSTVLNFIRTKKRYEARIVLDDELVANYISRDYTELNHTLYDLEKVLGKDLYVIYILRTAYDVTFDNIATLLDTNRENVRRKYLQSVKIVEEFLEE